MYGLSYVDCKETPPKIKALAGKILLDCRDAGLTYGDMIFLQRQISEYLDELRAEVELKKLESLP